MSLYLFVVAAAIAVFGILIVFKMNVEKIKEDPKQVETAQRNFFIGAAISESIPIVILVFLIANIEPIHSMNDILLPGIIIFLIMAFSAFFILLQRSVGVPEESKAVVNQLSIIAIAMAQAIPIVALIFLFISLG